MHAVQEMARGTQSQEGGQEGQGERRALVAVREAPPGQEGRKGGREGGEGRLQEMISFILKHKLNMFR